MQDNRQDRSVAPGDFDFEALYQGKEPLPGIGAGFDKPPWDLGEPQPVIVALEETGALRSDGGRSAVSS